MNKINVTDFVILDNKQDMGISCLHEDLKSADIESMDLVLNKKGLDNKQIFFKNKTDVIIFNGVEDAFIKKIYELKKIILIIIKDDKVFESYELEL